MTPKVRAAMQQALEALEMSAMVFNLEYKPVALAQTKKAITALREALAEPDIEEMTLTQIAARHEQAEQEPVANVVIRNGLPTLLLNKDIKPDDVLLYAAPVRTKDLTDDEIAQAVGSPLDEVYLADFRAVIAADRRKNR